MNRPAAPISSSLCLCLCLALLACTKSPESEGVDSQRGTGGAAAGGTGGTSSGSGGATGTGGAAAGTGGAAGSGGSSLGTGGAGSGGVSGTGGAGADAAADLPVDSPATPDATGADLAPGDFATLPGRPHIKLCKADWSQAQCCEFLCSCLKERCSDAPRAVPGIAGCVPTCMKLSNMLMRCHVYHCYEAKGPDFKDHESHCAHAANTLNGGGCPAGVVNPP